MLTRSRESGFTIAIKVSPGTFSTSLFQSLSCIEAHRDFQGLFHNELACYWMRVLAPQSRLPDFTRPCLADIPVRCELCFPPPKLALTFTVASLWPLLRCQSPDLSDVLSGGISSLSSGPFEAVFNSCQCTNFQVQTLTLDGASSAWLR